MSFIYGHPYLSLNCGLRPLNCDADVIKKVWWLCERVWSLCERVFVNGTHP